jgi:putative oxidoreductase
MELRLTLRARAQAALDAMAWLPPLLLRVTLGVVFFSTGLGKVQNLDKVTAFFTELGIPLPAFHAVVVGYTELVGGALLVAGLASRLAAVPLAVSMLVAVLTAKRAEITGVADFFGLLEVAYLVMLVAVAVGGAGAVSLDHLLARRLRGDRAPSSLPANALKA